MTSIETTEKDNTVDAPKRDLLTELTKNLTLPDGCDSWGIRSVHPDLRSSRGYRWPFPGNTATAPGPIDESNTDGCPTSSYPNGLPRTGDGICLAHSWKGMRSGGIAAVTLLLCAYASTHVLGRTENEQKIRVRECVVVDVIDGARMLREDGSSADLRSANLRYANLNSADLNSANLRYADLRSADLSYADLRYANLRYANLRYANLRYANLRDADLRSADLSDANLSDADLRSADLNSADLSSADLNSADLNSADLRYANLNSANLNSANLNSANLNSANLRYANLNSADLNSADLNSANLNSANLNSANLNSADLRYANLRYAPLANEYTICPTGYVVENGLLVRATTVKAGA